MDELPITTTSYKKSNPQMAGAKTGVEGCRHERLRRLRIDHSRNHDDIGRRVPIIGPNETLGTSAGGKRPTVSEGRYSTRTGSDAPYYRTGRHQVVNDADTSVVDSYCHLLTNMERLRSREGRARDT